MNREQYHAARREAYRLEQRAQAEYLSERKYSCVSGGYDASARTAEEARKIRASLRPRHDQYWLVHNGRAANIQRMAKEAVLLKKHRDFVKVEMAKLRPTGNRLQDGLNAIAISFGGRTAAEVMA